MVSHRAAPRDAATGSTEFQAIERFNTAFNLQDLDATMAAMTEGCVFENTSPAPDGTRHVGQDAVRSAFDQFFRSSPTARFDVEEMFAFAGRCVVRWVYTWDEDDPAGHVRGVDIFRVQDGKVTEKLSYVKG